MPAIAVHGGAGPLPRAELTSEDEERYRVALREALDAGSAMLDADGTAVDAVEAAVIVLEDSPLFNSARGAVLTHEGRIELDAALMDGRTGGAGAVAGVRHVRNPVRLARRVMDGSPHVLLIGEGADAFAAAEGFEPVAQEYFETPRRRAQLEESLLTGSTAADSMNYFGTVGAVALDSSGHLAAATSTGGMTNKRFGRVGDSPLIGAGTYASDATCAVSATGHGEYFIRGVVGHEINALVGYRGLTLADAVRTVIHDQLEPRGGRGGVIAVGRGGEIAIDFSTEGMFRAWRIGDGPAHVAIYDT